MATITGTSGDETLTGTASDDSIFPNGGVDTVDGLGGIDTIFLNYGSQIPSDNRWRITATNASGTSGTVGTTAAFSHDLVTFSNVESIDLQATGWFVVDGRLTAGAGTIHLTGLGTDDRLELTLSSLTSAISFNGSGPTATINHGSFDGFEMFTVFFGSAGDTAIGSAVQDLFLGNGGNDNLSGNAGLDSLYGGDGTDTLDGGDDADMLFGGAGGDTLIGGNGNDLLHASDDLARDVSTAVDHLNGGAGNDRLVAGYGDVVDGGADYDIVTLDFVAATGPLNINLTNAFSGGTSAVGTGSVSNVEAYYAIIGSGFDDTMTIGGVGGFDLNGTGVFGQFSGISGGGGNDTINGGTGSDSIDGGIGNDSITGHGGNDSIGGGTGDDVLSGNDGFDTISGGDGIDTLYGGADADNLYGNAGNDKIYGQDGDDILDGGDGNNVLDGGIGNDQIFFGFASAETAYGGDGADIYYNVDANDVIFEGVNEGWDKVVATGSVYLFANVEALDLSLTSGNFFGVGTDGINDIRGGSGNNLLIAGDGGDLVYGGAGNDSIYGQAGDDELHGDTGVDYMVGGSGNDYIYGDDGADALYGEDGGDILFGGFSFDTDILVGGAGNDLLNGMSAQANPDFDLMDGGAGDDTYWVDTGDDKTFEAVGGGIDTVYAEVPVANAGVYLYANVENLILGGTTAFGVGNELDNQMTGSDSGNWLLGGAGADTINGKGGNDVLFGEAGADTFVIEAASGADVIGDFVHGTDKIKLTGIYADFASASQHFVQVGGDGAIDLGGGNLVVLLGVQINTLNAGDFQFG